MRVLVCGGRDYGNLPEELDHPNREQKLKEYEHILYALSELSLDWSKHSEDKYGNWLPNVTIISGVAKGVDTVAIDWAVLNWCPFEEYPANWSKHGKAAGPIRNQQMLDEGKPDLVVAFPGGRGTAHMVRLAKAAGVPVKEINGVTA